MQKIEKPKVFISYAWSTEEYQNRVISFVNELIRDGIQVIFDKYDLHGGNDTNYFMEQSVSDETVTNVLIMLDPVYEKKADHRQGGVGTETQIISPEVYNKTDQTKFIPVVFQRDEGGAIPKPVYLRNTFHFDLSDDELYDEEYKRLVKTLYGEEIYKKPALGSKPKWVTESFDDQESIRISRRNRLKKSIMKEAASRDVQVMARNIVDDLESFSFVTSEQKAIEMYQELREIKGKFLDIVYLIPYNPELVNGIIESLEEGLSSLKIQQQSPQKTMKLTLIHELFIYIVAICFKHSLFKQLGYIFSRSYYSNDYKEFDNFTVFRTYNDYIDIAMNNRDNTKYVCGLATFWLENIDSSICNKKDYVFADVLCFNASIFQHENNTDHYWFPLTYHYMGEDYNSPLRVFARKMESKERLDNASLMFGFPKKDDFIKAFKEIEQDVYERLHNYRHMNTYASPQTIFEFIKSSELGIKR